MTPDVLTLIIPAFIAGLLTFLAPCTLPLVPAYLGFISGTTATDLKNPQKAKNAQRRVFINGLSFMVGVTVVFVLFGTLAGLLGQSLAPWRIWLMRIGGAFIVLFGLYMVGILKLPFLASFLSAEHKIKIPFAIRPGNPVSSGLLGASFAFGWTPCVGPILGSILLLASTSTTVFQGGFLLFIFSMGLAVPFLIIASGFGAFAEKLTKVSKYIEFVGGVFLIFLGILLLMGNFSLVISYGYQLFEFINYEALLNYL